MIPKLNYYRECGRFVTETRKDSIYTYKIKEGQRRRYKKPITSKYIATIGFSPKL